MDNPIDNFIDDPNNPFERVKKAAGEALSSAAQTEVGQKVLQTAMGPLSTLEKLAIPYREYAAPAISAALLELNSNYRKQNANMATVDQFMHAFKLAKSNVPGKEDWRRSVSPGRALVGLIGDWNFTGEQGTDKLDWSNAAEVDRYFSSGSAQFYSGLADAGFNLLDPVAGLAGTGSRLARRELVTRPVQALSKRGRVGDLVNELDAAVANPGADNGANAILKHVEKNQDNIQAIAAYGFVAASNNPNRLAVALSDAFKANGTEGVADVIKASLGHKQSLEKLKNNFSSIHESLLRNTGTNLKQREEIDNITAAVEAKNYLTIAQRDAMLDEKKRLTEAVKQIDEQNRELYAKANKLAPVVQQDFGVNETWSKFGFIERMRTTLAEAQSGGIFVHVDPDSNFQLARAIGKETGMGTLAARTLMWVSPNQQLKEVPAGMAFLGGAPGEWAYREYDARVALMGKIGGMSTDEMKSLSTQMRRATSKTERYELFSKLIDRSFQLLVQKHYGKKLSDLTPQQQEALNVFLREMVDSTQRAQSREIENILSKNYTFMDNATGDVVANKMMSDIVERLASERAAGEGRTATDVDRNVVRQALKNNQLTETQVPDVHFGVDMKFFDQIMSENPQLLRGMVDAIVEGNRDATWVRDKMARAERSAIEGSNSMGMSFDDTLKPLIRAAGDVAADGIDTFYTYVWKPFTLLSFKYTTRNVFEGWLRIIASMVDFNANYGYGWTDMIRASHEPGTIARMYHNAGYRKKSRESKDKFNEQIQEMKAKEGLLRRQLSTPGTTVTSAANSARNSILDAANKRIFEENDGMTTCISFIKNQSAAMSKYKPSTNTEANRTAIMLAETVRWRVEGADVKTSSPYAKAFIERISEGDYSKAHAIATRSNSGEILDALAQYLDSIVKVSNDLASYKHNGAETVGYALDNTTFALSRLILHTQKTMALLAERANLQGEIASTAAKSAPSSKAIKAFGSTQREIYPGIMIDAGLAGEAGEMLRQSTSSRASATRVIADDRRITGHGLMSRGYARRPVEVYDELWAEGHTDYVNNVMMKDAAIRHMVEGLAEGKTKAEVLKETRSWIDSADLEAVNWKKETQRNITALGAAIGNGFDYNDELAVMMLQIEQHLPSIRSVDQSAYVGLYEKAVKGMTPADSSSLDINDRFPIIAMRELHDKHTMSLIYKNAVGNIFHFIGTLPEDHLVRHPFFNMVHDNEAMRLAGMYEREARAQKGATEESVRAYLEANKDRIKAGAVNRGYKETMARLYSVERQTMPSKMMRWIAPFYMAHQNSSRFWLGTSLRNPDIAYMALKAYNAPFRAGYVYDKNGELVAEGTPWDPDSASQTIQMAQPTWLRNFTGRDMFTANPTALDVVTQGQLPVLQTLGGPGGETITKESLKLIAKNTGTDAFLQKHLGVNIDEFSAKYIMPYYERDAGQSVLQSAYSSAVPFNSATVSILAAAYGMYGKLPVIEAIAPSVKSRWNTRYMSAVEQVQMRHMLDGEPLNSEEIAKEAGEIARRALLVESVSSAVGPVVAVKTDDKRTRNIRQEFAALQKQDPLNASVKMVMKLEEQGAAFPSAVVAELRLSATNNRFGFYSNVETVKGVQKNLDSLSKAAHHFGDNPFISALFNQVGPNSKYSAMADDMLYSTIINGAPAKSKNTNMAKLEKDAQMKAAWATYFDNLDYIEAHAKANNVEKNSDAYNSYYKVWKENLFDAVNKQFPVFQDRDAVITLHKADQSVKLAYFFLNDKQFMNTVGKNNPVIDGIAEYIKSREDIMVELDKQRAATGVMSITSKTNQAYDAWRNATLEAIKLKYPESAQVLDRYFADDEFNHVESSLIGSK